MTSCSVVLFRVSLCGKWKYKIIDRAELLSIGGWVRLSPWHYIVWGRRGERGGGGGGGEGGGPARGAVSGVVVSACAVNTVGEA